MLQLARALEHVCMFTASGFLLKIVHLFILFGVYDLTPTYPSQLIPYVMWSHKTEKSPCLDHIQAENFMYYNRLCWVVKASQVTNLLQTVNSHIKGLSHYRFVTSHTVKVKVCYIKHCQNSSFVLYKVYHIQSLSRSRFVSLSFSN